MKSLTTEAPSSGCSLPRAENWMEQELFGSEFKDERLARIHHTFSSAPVDLCAKSEKRQVASPRATRWGVLAPFLLGRHGRDRWFLKNAQGPPAAWVFTPGWLDSGGAQPVSDQASN
jgi:hypothetical protein